MATYQQLRSAVAELSRLAGRDLGALFASVDTPQELRTALEDVLPALVEQYGIAAATLGAQWYDELRDEAGVPGRFEAAPVEVGAVGTDALAGVAVGPLFKAESDLAAARTLAEGGLQRRIANYPRQTVMQATIADPQAQGWQRKTSGGCAFCQMLEGRGAVYSERTADFASHDHCGCFAVPAFKGEPLPVRPYTPTDRRITDADRARVREYLRTN